MKCYCTIFTYIRLSVKWENGSFWHHNIEMSVTIQELFWPNKQTIDQLSTQHNWALLSAEQLCLCYPPTQHPTSHHKGWWSHFHICISSNFQLLKMNKATCPHLFHLWPFWCGHFVIHSLIQPNPIHPMHSIQPLPTQSNPTQSKTI